MKKALNRLLTLGIGCLLAFSSTFSTLAASDGNLNGGGSGSNQTGSTIEYIASFHAYQINNGIQASIVRKSNGQIVSNTITMNSYLPTKMADCPDGNLKKYWQAYVNKTGMFDTKKTHMLFLGGSKTDTGFVQSRVNLANPGGGVAYMNHTTGKPEIGKMYTYADIEYAMKASLDNFYTVKHPEYASAYQAAGGSPIDPAGGVYPATGATKNFLGPVELQNGRNTATGDNFKAQMNTKLPDGMIILQHFLDLEITKRNGVGQVAGGVEPLFYFTDIEMQARYNELKAENAKNPIVQVMQEFDLYAEFENVAWMVNEMSNPYAPAGYNKTGLTGESFWNTPDIYYGTPKLVTYQTAKDFVRYIQAPESYARALTPEMKAYLAEVRQEIGVYSSEEIDNNYWVDRANQWFSDNAIGQTWDWSLAYQAFSLDKPEPQMGLKTFADVGVDRNTVESTIAGNLSYWFEHMNDLGYGVMLFSPVPLDQTSTFDEINYSSSSTGWYRPGPSEDKSTDGGTEAKNRIVKYYANKLSNEYIYTENHTRENTVSQVTLENEEGYKVDSWFTSSEFRKPTSNNDSYDDCKNSIPNKQTGTSTRSVQLDKEDTLYLRLVKQPEVTKIYESNGATDKVVVDNNPQFENGSLIVTTPDEGYNYVEGVESPENADPDSWSDVPAAGNSTTDTRIPVKDTTKEIFIHYKKPDTDANMILHENELSHQFGLSDANNGVLVQGVVNYSSVSSGESCDEDVGDDDDYEACGSDYEWVDSEAWHFSLSNHKVYDPKFVWDWKQTGATSWGADDLGESGGDRKTGSNEPDGRMVLQRSFSDRPVLYPNMNQNTESTLINMGLNAPSYIPKADRYGNKPEQPSRVSWTGTFETDWVFDSNSPLATFEPSCGHGGSDTDTHNTSNNKSELDGAYSKPNNTTIYGLWGKENKGDKALTDTAQQNIWKLSTLNFKGFKNHIKEQSFTFYPYYKMKFISELDGAEQDAYLTAENLSTLLSLQRVDTSIFRPNGAITLELTSSQWSTHAKAHNLLDAAGVENKNSLLPAGAIYDLRTAGSGVKASQSWVGYRVFNSYVMDKNALADATNVKTKQEVVDAVNAFKNDTKNVLSNYEVVMVGQEGINPDDNNGEFYRGSEVITGKDGSYRLGQEFIRDSKYDLQTTGSASGNSSDIDVLEELEETYDWVLTSDADGNVVITRNGTELERLQKNQKNLTNAEVKEFDSRTNIVTNFLSAIDRNMGSDRNGKTWYNEGFSIGCLETRLAYRMGFGDGDASLRSTALNIKANGKLENRNDMFNGDEAKNRSYQFFTSARSTLNGCEKDYVGTYDGIKIFIPNMNQLLVSNRFYTSNTTVMDLN